MPDGTARMDRKSLVMAGIAAAQGATLEPVHVQKFFFLVDKKIPELVGGPHFKFQAYAYGPFDKNVYTTIETLEAEGLVEVLRLGTHRHRCYRATQEGQHRGDQFLAEMPNQAADFLRRLSEFVRSLSFAELVSTIYDAYPKMRENSIFVQYS